MFALKLSLELNLLNRKTVDKTINHLKNVGLPTALPSSFKRKTSLKQFLSVMKKDKKVKKGKINLVLLKEIGSAFVTNKFSEEKLNKVILSQIK